MIVEYAVEEEGSKPNKNGTPRCSIFVGFSMTQFTVNFLFHVFTQWACFQPSCCFSLWDLSVKSFFSKKLEEVFVSEAVLNFILCTPKSCGYEICLSCRRMRACDPSVRRQFTANPASLYFSSCWTLGDSSWHGILPAGQQSSKAHPSLLAFH